ncbi:hypothetical protein [Polaribacter sp. Hel1_85]|uniref:hypothetical protein n=1 Tax=Polaribacter sp. Hel1_85 TaxID=1250005 RepID=UPI00052C7DFC|nr:hypothetical protein [Polaribacter sp. Hel1_85]KGL62805.1 hypothetical protein PHEL85_2600 [Polaribacter sp. Hel1_85]
MKKVLLVFGFILAATFSTNAQDISNHAIGLRLTNEISYQKSMGENNRLEVNLGLRNDLKATGLYQWVWKIENKLNWFAGVGGGFSDDSSVKLFGSGVVGIEYNFESPFLVSIDYRPEIGITGALNELNSDFGISVRYQF